MSRWAFILLAWLILQPLGVLQPAQHNQTAALAMAQTMTPAASATPEARRVINTIPPTPQGLSIYVTDPVGLLTPDDKARLQQRLQALDESGIAQIAVLILPDTDRDLSEFAPLIMNKWDIQHHKKKDGLLVLVNAERVQHGLSGNRIFVATGYNLEGRLPDAVVGRVLDTIALPAFAQGNFSGGVTQSTLMLADMLAGKQPLPQPRHKSQSPDGVAWVILIIILFSLFNAFRRRGGGMYWGGGDYGGGGGFGDGGGSDFGGGFGGGGDSSGGGGAGR